MTNTKFTKTINKMKAGEKIYINAICLNSECIDDLRSFIQSGTLQPIEPQRFYNDVESVMNGKVILPQMEYKRA